MPTRSCSFRTSWTRGRGHEAGPLRPRIARPIHAPSTRGGRRVANAVELLLFLTTAVSNCDQDEWYPRQCVTFERWCDGQYVICLATPGSDPIRYELNRAGWKVGSGPGVHEDASSDSEPENGGTTVWKGRQLTVGRAANHHVDP